MVKGIVVSFAGEESSFALEKIDRTKLYGSRRRVAVDSSGTVCSRAALTEDGQAVLRAGMTAQGYFDPDGRQVESASLTAVDEAGNPLDLVASTLGVAQQLTGPVDPKELLDLAVTAVYQLVPEKLAPGLSAEIAAGRILRAPFNYRPDYRSELAYILQNDAGCFAVIGVLVSPTWLEPDAPPPADDAESDDGDLDFEMF